MYFGSTFKCNLLYILVSMLASLFIFLTISCGLKFVRVISALTALHAVYSLITLSNALIHSGFLAIFPFGHHQGNLIPCFDGSANSFNPLANLFALHLKSLTRYCFQPYHNFSDSIAIYVLLSFSFNLL